LARTFLDTTHYLKESYHDVEKVIAHGSCGVGFYEYERSTAAAKVLEVQNKIFPMRTATFQYTPVPSKATKLILTMRDGWILK
jgi:hypothetical protein